MQNVCKQLKKNLIHSAKQFIFFIPVRNHMTIKVIKNFVRPFRVSVDLCNLNVNIINANVSLMHP